MSQKPSGTQKKLGAAAQANVVGFTSGSPPAPTGAALPTQSGTPTRNPPPPQPERAPVTRASRSQGEVVKVSAQHKPVATSAPVTVLVSNPRVGTPPPPVAGGAAVSLHTSPTTFYEGINKSYEKLLSQESSKLVKGHYKAVLEFTSAQLKLIGAKGASDPCGLSFPSRAEEVNFLIFLAHYTCALTLGPAVDPNAAPTTKTNSANRPHESVLLAFEAAFTSTHVPLNCSFAPPNLELPKEGGGSGWGIKALWGGGNQAGVHTKDIPFLTKDNGARLRDVLVADLLAGYFLPSHLVHDVSQTALNCLRFGLLGSTVTSEHLPPPSDQQETGEPPLPQPRAVGRARRNSAGSRYNNSNMIGLGVHGELLESCLTTLELASHCTNPMVCKTAREISQQVLLRVTAGLSNPAIIEEFPHTTQDAATVIRHLSYLSCTAPTSTFPGCDIQSGGPTQLRNRLSLQSSSGGAIAAQVGCPQPNVIVFCDEADAAKLTPHMLNGLLMVLVNGSPYPTFRRTVEIREAIRRYLMPVILQRAASADYDVYRLAYSTFLTLFSSPNGSSQSNTCSPSSGGFFDLLIPEIGAMFGVICNLLSVESTAEAQHKLIIVEVLSKIVSEPKNLIELFLNFDCVGGAPNVYEELVHTLTALYLSLSDGSASGTTFLSHMTQQQSTESDGFASGKSNRHHSRSISGSTTPTTEGGPTHKRVSSTAMEDFIGTDQTKVQLRLNCVRCLIVITRSYSNWVARFDTNRPPGHGRVLSSETPVDTDDLDGTMSTTQGGTEFAAVVARYREKKHAAELVEKINNGHVAEVVKLLMAGFASTEHEELQRKIAAIEKEETSGLHRRGSIQKEKGLDASQTQSPTHSPNRQEKHEEQRQKLTEGRERVVTFDHPSFAPNAATKPSNSVAAKIEALVLQAQYDHVAQFLRAQEDYISKVKIGEYFSGLRRKETVKHVLTAWLSSFSFRGKAIDEALREFLGSFKLVGEAAIVDTTMELFSEAYLDQNTLSTTASGLHPDPTVSGTQKSPTTPSSTGLVVPPTRGNQTPFKSASAAFVLAFSICMLNTDAHNISIPDKDKMQIDGFIRNNRGINDNEDLPVAYLEGVYRRVKEKEIKLRPTAHFESETQDAMDAADKAKAQQAARAKENSLVSGIPILKHIAPVTSAVTSVVLAPVDMAGERLFRKSRQEKQTTQTRAKELQQALRRALNRMEATANPSAGEGRVSVGGSISPVFLDSFQTGNTLEHAIPMWLLSTEHLVSTLVTGLMSGNTTPGVTSGSGGPGVVVCPTLSDEEFAHLLEGISHSVHISARFGNMEAVEPLFHLLFDLTGLKEVIDVQSNTMVGVMSHRNAQCLSTLLKLYVVDGASCDRKLWEYPSLIFSLVESVGLMAVSSKEEQALSGVIRNKQVATEAAQRNRTWSLFRKSSNSSGAAGGGESPASGSPVNAGSQSASGGTEPKSVANRTETKDALDKVFGVGELPVVWSKLLDITVHPAAVQCEIVAGMCQVVKREYEYRSTFTLVQLTDTLSVLVNNTTRMVWREVWLLASEAFLYVGGANAAAQAGSYMTTMPQTRDQLAICSVNLLKEMVLNFVHSRSGKDQRERIQYADQREVLRPLITILTQNSTPDVRRYIVRECLGHFVGGPDYFASLASTSSSVASRGPNRSGGVSSPRTRSADNSSGDLTTAELLVSGWFPLLNGLAHAALFPEVVVEGWCVMEQIVLHQVPLLPLPSVPNGCFEAFLSTLASFACNTSHPDIAVLALDCVVLQSMSLRLGCQTIQSGLAHPQQPMRKMTAKEAAAAAPGKKPAPVEPRPLLTTSHIEVEIMTRLQAIKQLELAESRSRKAASTSLDIASEVGGELDGESSVVIHRDDATLTSPSSPLAQTGVFYSSASSVQVAPDTSASMAELTGFDDATRVSLWKFIFDSLGPIVMTPQRQINIRVKALSCLMQLIVFHGHHFTTEFLTQEILHGSVLPLVRSLSPTYNPSHQTNASNTQQPFSAELAAQCSLWSLAVRGLMAASVASLHAREDYEVQCGNTDFSATQAETTLISEGIISLFTQGLRCMNQHHGHRRTDSSLSAGGDSSATGPEDGATVAAKLPVGSALIAWMWLEAVGALVRLFPTVLPWAATASTKTTSAIMASNQEKETMARLAKLNTEHAQLLDFSLVCSNFDNTGTFNIRQHLPKELAALCFAPVPNLSVSTSEARLVAAASRGTFDPLLLKLRLVIANLPSGLNSAEVVREAKTYMLAARLCLAVGNLYVDSDLRTSSSTARSPRPSLVPDDVPLTDRPLALGVFADLCGGNVDEVHTQTGGGTSLLAPSPTHHARTLSTGTPSKRRGSSSPSHLTPPPGGHHHHDPTGGLASGVEWWMLIRDGCRQSLEARYSLFRAALRVLWLQFLAGQVTYFEQVGKKLGYLALPTTVKHDLGLKPLLQNLRRMQLEYEGMQKKIPPTVAASIFQPPLCFAFASPISSQPLGQTLPTGSPLPNDSFSTKGGNASVANQQLAGAYLSYTAVLHIMCQVLLSVPSLAWTVYKGPSILDQGTSGAPATGSSVHHSRAMSSGSSRALSPSNHHHSSSNDVTSTGAGSAAATSTNNKKDCAMLIVLLLKVTPSSIDERAITDTLWQNNGLGSLLPPPPPQPESGEQTTDQDSDSHISASHPHHVRTASSGANTATVRTALELVPPQRPLAEVMTETLVRFM